MFFSFLNLWKKNKSVLIPSITILKKVCKTNRLGVYKLGGCRFLFPCSHDHFCICSYWHVHFRPPLWWDSAYICRGCRTWKEGICGNMDKAIGIQLTFTLQLSSRKDYFQSNMTIFSATHTIFLTPCSIGTVNMYVRSKELKGKAVFPKILKYQQNNWRKIYLHFVN